MKKRYLFLRLLGRVRRFYSVDFFLFLGLVCLGVINLFIQYSANDKMLSRIITDGAYLVISFIILFLVANLSIYHLKTLAKPLYIFSILLLIAVLIIGTSHHGAKRWLNLGIQIQPSELCKLAVPLILAYYFAMRHTLKFNFKDYAFAFVLIFIPFLLIAKQPDLGTGILVFSAGFFVIFFAGLPWRVIVFALILFLISTPVIWHLLHPYQQHRILTLIHPSSDPLGKGYHVIQGIIAIGSGGLYGKGYLHGTQVHLNFIPEKSTDFVVSVLAEEFGFVGITTILIIYLLISLRGLYIMQRATDVFSKTLAGSISLSLMLYVLINMGMVAGILPVVGVPLPLISFGGTASIVLMCGFGILLAIAKQNKLDYGSSKHHSNTLVR